jgi:AbrB family looped-hinge helix DNA binding protein
MKSGKLTIKHQVTIPRDVRRALGLKAGDQVLFEVEEGRAVISKLDLGEPGEDWQRFALSQMPEWNDPEEDAYWADL